jgi:hypothetical protein
LKYYVPGLGRYHRHSYLKISVQHVQY